MGMRALIATTLAPIHSEARGPIRERAHKDALAAVGQHGHEAARAGTVSSGSGEPFHRDRAQLDRDPLLLGLIGSEVDSRDLGV